MSEQLAGLIDLPALKGFLQRHLPRQEGELDIEKHEAGFSNETFYVSWGQKHWVMRRPPRGDILPTAHDVLREYRVLSALASTGVRVPQPAVACEDRSVIGAPFYLMARVDGIVIRDDLPSQFDAFSDRRRIGAELIDALAELHAVDWQSASLATLGKPQGFLERQLRRWIGQLDLTLPHTGQCHVRRPTAGSAHCYFRLGNGHAGRPVGGSRLVDRLLGTDRRPPGAGAERQQLHHAARRISLTSGDDRPL